MGEPELVRQARAFRAAILAREAAAARRMTAVYGSASDAIAAALDGLLIQIEARLAAGGTTEPFWLLAQERYRVLLEQAEAQMERFARVAGEELVGARAEAARRGAADARQLILAGMAEAPPPLAAGFARLPTEAIEELAGQLAGGPLRRLLAGFAGEARTMVEDLLLDGLAVGHSPRTIGRQIADALAVGRRRAELIARTEYLRAYRAASLRTYQANGDVLAGWVWLAAKQARTCAACLALDGQRFALEETFFPAHPGCRCTAIPAVSGEPPGIQTGADWLAAQDAPTQDAVLGKAGGAAYRAGEVALADFVRFRESAEWGGAYQDGGVGWARQQAARRPDGQAARRS